MASPLGNYLRTRRGNLSLRDFATKCGISHTHLDSLEKGFDFRTGKPVSITIETLNQLAKNLDEDVIFLSCLALGMSEEDARMRTLPAEEIPNTFAAHLQRARVARSLSQEELSKKLSISLEDYKKMESGENRPDNILQIIDFAEKLKVNPDWLNCSMPYIDPATNHHFTPGEYKAFIDSSPDPEECNESLFLGFKVYPVYEVARQSGRNDILELFNSDPVTYSNLQKLFDMLSEMCHEGQEKVIGYSKDIKDNYKKDEASDVKNNVG